MNSYPYAPASSRGYGSIHPQGDASSGFLPTLPSPPPSGAHFSQGNQMPVQGNMPPAGNNGPSPYVPQHYTEDPQYVSQQYQNGYPQPSPAAPGRGFAIASLVLGICALVFSWVPLLGLYIGVSALVGLVMGVLSLVRIKQGKAEGKVMSIVGTALSALALIIITLVTILIVNMFSGVSGSLGESVSEENSELTWSSPAEGNASVNFEANTVVI